MLSSSLWLAWQCKIVENYMSAHSTSFNCLVYFVHECLCVDTLLFVLGLNWVISTLSLTDVICITTTFICSITNSQISLTPCWPTMEPSRSSLILLVNNYTQPYVHMCPCPNNTPNSTQTQPIRLELWNTLCYYSNHAQQSHCGQWSVIHVTNTVRPVQYCNRIFYLLLNFFMAPITVLSLCTWHISVSRKPIPTTVCICMITIKSPLNLCC